MPLIKFMQNWNIEIFYKMFIFNDIYDIWKLYMQVCWQMYNNTIGVDYN